MISKFHSYRSLIRSRSGLRYLGTVESLCRTRGLGIGLLAMDKWVEGQLLEQMHERSFLSRNKPRLYNVVVEENSSESAVKFDVDRRFSCWRVEAANCREVVRAGRAGRFLSKTAVSKERERHSDISSLSTSPPARSYALSSDWGWVLAAATAVIAKSRCTRHSIVEN